MKTNNSKEKVRQLQNKLYLTAKKCQKRRFHALYDKVYRDDVLIEAWKRVKANKGSSGVDGIRIEDIEKMGIEKYLKELKKELIEGKYIPSRYNLAYSRGSSMARAFNAQSDPGVVFKFFSASQQSMRSI